MTPAERRRHIVVKNDNTLVIMLDTQPYVELRPSYSRELGAHIEVYKVLYSEPQYLFTLHLATVGPLVKKLPIVVSAARRLARQVGKNDATEPNNNPASSSA